ncbi:MAG: SurA N-terminal domain-containing protein [Pseudomonadota bacterium]|nr:SurA N-terminal domain-containing protein [Pseudomonadota bacterium]MBU4121908.1 SurA N-terminal domain-containing protein [Pseudomonadota bacterium]
MEKLECPHCGSPLGRGVAVCGECGKEVSDEGKPMPEGPLPQEEKRGSKNIYAILAVFLVVVGGAALLMYSGLLPNPVKGGSTAAIVNGEKISTAEVDRKLEVYKKMYGQSGKLDSSSPEGKATLADMRRQILQTLIQDKVLVTEAVKEKITVSPQEIAERIAAIKKGMKLSDKDFEDFLKNHAMSIANFEKRIENEFLIARLIAKGAQEKGLTKDAWVNELNARAKVEILAK